MEKLAAAARIGHAWQALAKSGKLKDGMKLWGYHAFEEIKADEILKRLEAQSALLGALEYSELMEDRCLIDLDGTSVEGEEKNRGVYITLRYFNEYKNGARRESIVLYEPKTKGTGPKITGLRRERIPSGRQGLVDLATDLGQLALLKLRGAPAERWAPYQREAAALAAKLKLTLPPVPDAPDAKDAAGADKLVKFLMTDSVGVVDKSGIADGAAAAKSVLNAFAMLLLYTPGDETSTRLAVLAGSEAEKARIPGGIWKPMIKAVSEKGELPAVHDAVQQMAAGISSHVAAIQESADIKVAPREILSRALAIMSKLETYKVRGELTAADGRKCIMDATLAPAVMDLTMQGFDGKRERRFVSEGRFRVSSDEGRTWREDPDPETTRGLCRTLQTPLDAKVSLTDKHEFVFAGRETVDGEELYRFDDALDESDDPARSYWVLLSRGGPVIRRAKQPMKFGDLATSALIIYTRLGKEVHVPDLDPPEE
jgi:hypothetical protein